MPPKRPQSTEPTGAQKKRQRMREQRTIPVSSTSSVGRNGGSAGQGNTGLPPTIEVEKFAQARSFEISAMQKSMKAAKQASTVRAFQSLPRHLRRRAASHNIRRLPTRLRNRARGEVPEGAAKPKRVTRGMVGRHRKKVGLGWGVKKGMKKEMFLRRQQKKIWLETHVWHAKRMHMTEIWGHRLALTPTAKAHRASYRAAAHGCIVHDASYFQYMLLEGMEEELIRLVEGVCDPAEVGPGSKRFTSGARECTTDIYDSTQTYPRGLLGPATFIWRPLHLTSAASASTSASKPPLTRHLLLRLHPSLASSALSSLQALSNSVAFSSSSPALRIHPLTRTYQTFELTGPRSTEVLKRVLRLVKGTDGETREFWEGCKVGEGPGGVPMGCVVGVRVYDPRLSFPPKLQDKDKQPPGSSSDEPLIPSARVADCPEFWETASWSDEEKEKMGGMRFSKAELDERRRELLVPGTPLTPLAQDTRLPILLSQRTLGVSSSSSSAPEGEIPVQHSWVFTLPAAPSTLTSSSSSIGMALWSSLVYSTSSIAGLTQRSQQFQETGHPRYPEDYVGTTGFGEFETRREDEEKGYWERRPPAKRESWEKLEIDEPWRVRMGEVCWRSWDGKGEESGQEGEEGEEWVISGRVMGEVLEKLREVREEQLKGKGKGKGIGKEQDAKPKKPLRPAAAKLVHDLVDAYLARITSPSNPTPTTRPLLASAIVRVHLDPLGRGRPQELGLVYEVEEEVAREVVEKLKKGEKGSEAHGEGEGAEDLCARPKKEQVIGRVTTGGFSLSQGKGRAMAVVSLFRYLDIMMREGQAKGVVLFRNRDSETFRAGRLSLVRV